MSHHQTPHQTLVCPSQFFVLYDLLSVAVSSDLMEYMSATTNIKLHHRTSNNHHNNSKINCAYTTQINDTVKLSVKCTLHAMMKATCHPATAFYFYWKCLTGAR